MKILKYSLICIALMAGASSCEKDGFVPLSDVRPAIPLIVSNGMEFRPGYTVRASRADGNFKFDLEIPASSGRSIKEITNIVAGTGPGRFFSRTPSTDFVYINTPIAGTGNKASFASTLTQFTAITKRAVPANNAANAVELPLQFFFLVTLDDNSTLVSEPVRVLVVP
ncbi:hypothetical protein [Pseudobacter ginsenosidimutans]|uniref:Uncharacterized protein n=1 Tax=Pseudobacter ginsenosidimutans TaxID=661488 RepID=A0A4Q7N4G5_9BACT|nr:hypothetical protein [Pseudobacter ginsenosidimutans]QEC44417.1 hypothetical protein FSB84_23085 [Pseudobacter ginsenosidimutans]RZS75888.1 hypothetical protein EV199_1764 [Pseudobacter ginsenosidimutans]